MKTAAWRLVLALAVCIVAAASADAAQRARRAPHSPRAPRTEPICPRTGTRAAVVARVTDGDTFFAADGSEIDLPGVLAPGSGGERLGAEQAALARTALQDALATGDVTLAVNGQPDRYGRLKAQVFAGNEWVQARLLSGGLVRAAPDLASGACAPALLAIEKRAREGGAGHWGDGTFAVQSPESLRRVTGTFQIVEGAVQSAAVVKSRVYLNFGADWHSDFTATIAPEDKAAFRRVHVDWKALAGKRVRVRGWMEFYNGPMISLHAPGEIEFLDVMPKLQPAHRPRKPRTPKAASRPQNGQ